MELVIHPQYCVDAWHNLTFFVEDNIFPLQEIISLKSIYLELLTNKDLSIKFVFAWAGYSNLYKNGILAEGDKKSILVHLRSPDLQVRSVAWVALCKLDLNQLVRASDLIPYKSFFLELIDNEKDDWELWTCLITLKNRNVFIANEIANYVQSLESMLTSGDISREIRAMTSLLLIWGLENNVAKIKILKERIGIKYRD